MSVLDTIWHTICCKHLLSIGCMLVKMSFSEMAYSVLIGHASPTAQTTCVCVHTLFECQHARHPKYAFSLRPWCFALSISEGRPCTSLQEHWLFLKLYLANTYKTTSKLYISSRLSWKRYQKQHAVFVQQECIWLCNHYEPNKGHIFPFILWHFCSHCCFEGLWPGVRFLLVSFRSWNPLITFQFCFRHCIWKTAVLQCI